jgi:hypothetical protein
MPREPVITPVRVVDPATGEILANGIDFMEAEDLLRTFPEERRIRVVRISDEVLLSRSWAESQWEKGHRGPLALLGKATRKGAKP